MSDQSVVTAPPLPTKSDRLVSLDAFRGITIAGMVLVNNPGTWAHMYTPLGHAQWHGQTPTDWIFPFFLFIVGVAMTFSFDKRLALGASRRSLLLGAARRAAVLFLLGLIMSGFPNFRIITPYILAIFGLNLFLPDVVLLRQELTEQVRRKRMIGGGLLAFAVVWFIVNWGHFSAPSVASTWSNLFPLGDVEGGRFQRVPGVLQRIALAFLGASFVVVFFKNVGRIAWIGGLLVGYYLIMLFFNAPSGYELGDGAPRTWAGAPEDVPFRGELNDWIDVKILGRHLYGERPDPEGLLSTIPAIASVLFGVLAGSWLRMPRTKVHIALGMVAAGAVLMVAGWLWGLTFPINKKIWTSSYVVFTTGAGLWFLAFCYWLIDHVGAKKWAWPFVVFGTNAIFVFFASGILARIMSMIMVPWDDGTTNLKNAIYRGVFVNIVGEDGKLSSFLFAFFYIFLWLGLTYPLYRKRIFWKI